MAHESLTGIEVSVPTRLAEISRFSNQNVDREVASLIRAKCESRMEQLRSLGDGENGELLQKIETEGSPERSEFLQGVRSEVLSVDMRVKLCLSYGEERTDLLYKYLYRRLSDPYRRLNLAVGMLKISRVNSALRITRSLSAEEFVAFVDLVDGMTNLPKVDEATLMSLQGRREKLFIDKNSPLIVKAIRKFIPDAEHESFSNILLGFIKEKMNLGGKEVPHTDEICMDLLVNSPFSNCLMVVGAAITGSLGLMVFMLPLYTVWSTLSTTKSLIDVRKGIPDINSPTAGCSFTKLLSDSYGVDPSLEVNNGSGKLVCARVEACAPSSYRGR